MAGNIKLNYAAATTTMTTTNLQSLASSQTWIGGWGSANVVNTTNVYLDYIISGTFKTSSASRQATGYVNVYVIGTLNDTPTFGTVATGTAGTEGAITFTDTFRRDAQCRLLQSLFVGESGSATIYDIPQTGISQLFGGVCPNSWYLYIAQNCATTTAAGLASSGNAIYYTPIMAQYT